MTAPSFSSFLLSLLLCGTGFPAQASATPLSSGQQDSFQDLPVSQQGRAEIVSPQSVLSQAIRANRWFMHLWPDPGKDTFIGGKIRPSSLWTRAVYYEGLMALYALQPDTAYYDYALRWSQAHQWMPRNVVTTHDADDYCCAQTYIDLYRLQAPGATLQYVEACMRHILERGEESDADWWWIDALQMGMPVLQKLARETGNGSYAAKAWSMYRYTRDRQDGGLRNPKDGLWWRDRDFNPPYRTPGGKDCYWSRGNGWVAAALVRVLDEMQPAQPHYQDYLADLIQMLRSLIPLQREDGFWNVSLADPTDFGGPEVTGTSLFLYAMAWCVNHGYLPREEFVPVMHRAWAAMSSCVHPDGKLGWQQGTGKQPSDSQPVSYSRVPDFEDYGLGCFLLGATEYCRTLSDLSGTPLVSPPSAVPSPTSSPGIRWWWLGSAVTEEGLLYNLRQFADKGIRTVEITPIYGVQGNDSNNIPFLSLQWMKMLRTCIIEGGRLGIQVDMNCGTGWPFGGPEVPLDEAACCLKVEDVLTDAAATPGTEAAASVRSSVQGGKGAPKLIVRRSFPVKGGKVRTISLYQDRTRQKVKRAAPGGEGYVIDHFDSLAVAHYLERIERAFRETDTPYPATFFNDSYEVYGADWTPNLLREFRVRRGYDLLDCLPQFVDGDAQVIADYRETLAELLEQNFTRQWVAWCHRHGVKVRNQAHGSPANLIDIYSDVDVPEIEGFGLSDFGIKGLRVDSGMTRRNDSDLSMLKYAASASHVTGKSLASSETFTWLTEHFRTSLSQMKPDLDLMFCAGVNRMFFHGACYSPPNEPWPGWRFYASVDFSPTNTIWRDASSLTSYITRCQARLQEGQPDNDFLVLLPVGDMWRENTGKRLLQFDIHSMAQKAPQFIASILRLDSLGYDSDYISEQLLLQTRMVDGQLQTASGTRYRGLVLPMPSVTLSSALRRHLDALRRQGARIITRIDSAELVRAARPESLKTQMRLNLIRRRKEEGGYTYFVANLTPRDVCEQVAVSVTAQPFPLDLRSGESCFIDVDTQGQVLVSYPLQRQATQVPPTLLTDLTDQPWTLNFTESQPQLTETFHLPRLQTWETLPHDSLSELMGTGIYQTYFTLPQETSLQGMCRIDLGDVRESARVYLNGRYVGTVWAHPMTLDFPAWMLQARKNQLIVEVTNLPANRIAAYDRRDVPWRHFNEINVVDIHYRKTLYDRWAPMPSGLNSRVRLYRL